VTGWLTEARRMGALIEKIGEALQLLASKRATLEEKMIARHLRAVASALGSLLKRIFALLNEGDELAYADVLGALREVNLKIDEVLDQFLKIARFDPNFLEQYFEHDFCKRLNEDHRFLDVLNWIEIRFQEIS